MGRGERHHARPVRSPAAIQQHTPLAAQAGVQVRPAEVRPDNLIRRRGIADAHVRKQPVRQQRTVFGAHDLLVRVLADNVGFG